MIFCDEKCIDVFNLQGDSKKKQANFFDNHKLPQGKWYTKMTAIFWRLCVSSLAAFGAILVLQCQKNCLKTAQKVGAVWGTVKWWVFDQRRKGKLFRTEEKFALPIQKEKNSKNFNDFRASSSGNLHSVKKTLILRIFVRSLQISHYSKSTGVFWIGSANFSSVRNSLPFLLWSKTHHFTVSQTDPTFWAVFRQFFWHCKTRMAPNATKLDTHNLQKIAVILVYHLPWGDLWLSKKVACFFLNHPVYPKFHWNILYG